MSEWSKKTTEGTAAVARALREVFLFGPLFFWSPLLALVCGCAQVRTSSLSKRDSTRLHLAGMGGRGRGTRRVCAMQRSRTKTLPCSAACTRHSAALACQA